MNATFQPVRTDNDQRDLAQMADAIWHEYWTERIGAAQTDYMIERFQSLDVIKCDMAEHAYEYWFIVDEQGERVGYTGGHVEAETNRFFISKVYLAASARGRGLARTTMEFYERLCRDRKLAAMYLTVNKHNELGIRAYRGTGFEIIDAVETDIGEGFIMDDYIMEKQVAPTESPAA